MTTHRQRRVNGVLVDAKLADILRRLWKLGIKTSFSCEGDLDTLGYIQFSDTRSGIRFYELLMKMPEPGFITEWHCHGNQIALIVRFSDEGRRTLKGLLKELPAG